MTPVVAYFTHAASFVPAGLCALRRAGTRYWLVALALSLSGFADLVAWAFGGTWAVSYVLHPVQFGVIAWALGRPSVLWLLVGFALGQAVWADLTGPDVYMTVAGSLAVLVLARNTDLAWTLLTYCGLGTALYLMMIARLDDYAAFMPWWYAYQAARLTAFALFGRAVWRASSG